MHAFITVLILLSFISTHHLVCILTSRNCLHRLHIPPPFISFALPTHHLPTHLVTYHLNPILLISPQIGIPMFSQFPSYLSTNLLTIKMFFIMFLYPLMYVSHHYGLLKLPWDCVENSVPPSAAQSQFLSHFSSVPSVF